MRIPPSSPPASPEGAEVVALGVHKLDAQARRCAWSRAWRGCDGRFNLSRWAIRHPQLIVFLILAIGVAGAFAYPRLGRAEDPAFTIKNAVVSAIWPGATTEEMQGQVADRIEKKLQELPWVDKIETYSKPGFASISFAFRDSTPPRDVPMLFLQLRKKMTDVKPRPARRRRRPGGQRRIRRRRFACSTRSPATARPTPQLKEVAKALRKRLQRVPDVEQGRSLRRPGRAHLRRIRATPSWRRSACRCTRSSNSLAQAERARRRPANSRPTRSACRCA